MTEDFLDRARGGDPRAFLEIVRAHDPALRALAWRLLDDRDRMDDVLQEAYIRAYRALARFDARSAVGTWLHRIVYNACIDDLRRRRPTVPLEAVPDRPDDRPGPEQVAARQDLATALAALPPDQRATVLLVDAEGFDHAAAAEVLGIAPGTVASRLHRARAALRAALTVEEDER